jgi:cytochrome b subunit of formate dehydrogenase
MISDFSARFPHLRRLLLPVLGLALLAVAALYPPTPLRGEDAQVIAPTDTETCLACHGEKIDGGHFAGSAHGRLSCQVCHTGIDRVPHPEKATAQKPQCINCHAIKTAMLSRSVHGAKNAKTRAVTCQTCHGKNAHEIKEVSKLDAAAMASPCLACHSKVSAQLKTSVHGKANGNTPSCLVCHGNNPHEIQPSTGVGAVPNDVTCRNCHTDAAKRLATSAHGQSGVQSANRLSCLSCHGPNAHTVHLPQGKAVACATCHAKIAGVIAHSAHGGAKAPTCQACHGSALHAIAPAGTLTSGKRELACKTCHAQETAALTQSVHGRAMKNGDTSPSCLSCHWERSHTITKPSRMDLTQREGACKTCHADKTASLVGSVHDRPDVVPGDHPTCLSCHGGKVHDISAPKRLTPTEQIALCSSCHNDAAKMARYGLTTGAVLSYEQSFHGRAVMRFGKKNSATCTDCHGLHGVLAPNDVDAPTNPANLAQTCGKCHTDSGRNFAVSGASHLRLRIQSSPILLVEEVFFMVLIMGTMFMLFLMVLLDLRRKAFYPGAKPEAGRLVSVLIAISFLLLTGGIALAFLRVNGVEWLWIGALASVVLAFIVNAINRARHPHPKAEKHYPRFTLVMRFQHAILASTFTLLVLTGLPLHFADVGWMHYILVAFGGFEGARVVHRVCGVAMVVNWIWHLGYLLLLWKRAGFTWSSWTMLPTKKDVRDVIDYFKYLLGLRQDPPAWDRFQFREKFDYYADIWGTIVMGSTGFVLWFPTTLGNKLPDLAFGFSYIAHSYEGLLAMMAIIVWHFYNTHFNPDTFPMNPTWLTGTMSASEMEREHPLEKARVDAETAAKVPTGK